MEKQSDNSQNTPVKIPFFKLLLGGYGLFIDYIKQFVILGTVFSLILSLLFFVSGQDALCSNHLYRAEHYCTNSDLLYLAVHIIALYVICMFIRCWCQLVDGNTSFNWRVLLPSKADFKVFAMMLLSIAVLSVSFISAYLLYIREPNPDWRIEICYFAVVSLGFFAPVLGMRFFSYISFAAENLLFPRVVDVWRKTKGSTVVMLISALFVMLITLFLFISITQRVLLTDNINSFMVAIGSEYISNLAVFFIWALIANYSIIQKQILFEGKTNG